MRTKNAVDYLQPISTARRTEAVLDALVEMIELAGLEIGDKLPPEMQLSTELGVGRTTIREALNQWEGLGLVKRRRGSGTYLTARIRASKGVIPTKTKLEGEGMLRILDIRRTLEIESNRRAATFATDEQIKEICEKYDRILEVAASGRRWFEADGEFHQAIHMASGNPLFGEILHGVDAAFQAAKYSESPFDRPEFGQRSIVLHADLRDAIIAHDPDAAEAAICAILDKVTEEIRELTGAE